MRTAKVRVAVFSRLNHQETAAPDKLVIELANKEESEYYIIFTSFIVDKFYMDAFEFLREFKDQEDAVKELMKSGVAEFEFIGYNRFTIEKKSIMDEMYARLLAAQRRLE